MRPTKTFESVPVVERFVELGKGAQVLTLADAAREAALEFVSASRYGWGRLQLATWLVDSYRPATVDAGVRVGSSHPSRAADDRELRDESEITRLVARVRQRVIDLVSTASSTWVGQGFAREMIDAGLVIGITDRSGALGYGAVHRPNMRLADRVTSLFLADFLTRPADYRSLTVCRSCSEVSFLWDEVHEVDCEERGPVSGIVVKRPCFTRIGLGDRVRR